ncbi:MAG: AMP-binding protein [bacterium]|nr:ATP-dependent acyl-CoA ligase [Gammaproteobacteria bacterium]HIL97463.1 ATP-dependent acyl-CoA ligase [Pseudomonadales bacterium]
MTELNNLILADFFLGRAESNPDLQILTFECPEVPVDETRTFGEIWTNSQKLSAALIARGMNPGDSFAVMLRNHPEFIEAMATASTLGTAFVPLDPRTRGAKLAYTLNNSECKGIVCADYCVQQVVEIRDQVPGLEWLIMLENTGEDESTCLASDFQDCSSMGQVMDAAEVTVDRTVTDPMHPLQIMYTSGTTGDPKGVEIANARLAGGAMLGPALGFNPEDRPYTGLSLTHGNAQSLTLFPAIGMDLPTVFSRKFTKSRLWDITRKYHCTVFNLLGGMTTAIYSEPMKTNDADNPVRMVISAGMPAVIWKQFEERFNLKVVELYAAVDGYGLFMNHGDGPVGSFGQKPAGSEFKIVDDDGNELPHGEPGELIGRPLEGDVKVEYYKNKEASDKKTSGGWVRTGDVCHRDDDGWYYFDYRKGGGIRHNGDFINPGFVEKALAEHSGILDVFVYGVPAASGAPGEKDVVAAIVTNDEYNPASVFELCKRELEANFIPSYLQVVDEIPKTASEKPQERFLLEAFSVDDESVHVR